MGQSRRIHLNLIKTYEIPLNCHCERPKGAWQSQFVTARLLRRFAPRNDSLLIPSVTVSITLCILLAITLIDPIMVYGQSTGRMNISRENGRDPFVLPPGIRLLSKEDTSSVNKGVASPGATLATEIKPIDIPLKVTAILVSDHIRLASIDGYIATVGDFIHDEKILEIRNDRVVMGKGDKKRTLLLSQSPVQLTVEGK